MLDVHTLLYVCPFRHANYSLIRYHCIKLFPAFMQFKTDHMCFLGFGLIAMQFLRERCSSICMCML